MKKIVLFAVLPIAVFSVQLYTSFPVGNTAIWWVIQIVILIAFFREVRYNPINTEDKQAIRFVKWYLLWNVINIVRGIFVAEIYWDYKGLITMGMALLLPIVAYLALDKDRVQSILVFFFRYTLPAAILVFPFLTIGSWGWYLFPISLMMLFFPALPLRAKILVVLVTCIAALGDLGARSHVVKYGMPIVLLLLFYTSRYFIWSGRIMEVARKIMIIIPFVLFFLAVSGIFVIFKMDEYIKGELVGTKETNEGEVVQENLKADTRTFIYIEVLESAIKNNYWLIGRSPARGNDTVAFAEMAEETTGRAERLRNEVGILNTFTWTGIVGVVLLFLVFYKASYLAINRSRNVYVKLIGLFVAFRWAYSWVEDYQGFNMNNFVIWLMIGMCFSSSFRNMKDAEIKLWLWGIFERKYYWKYKYFTEKDELSKSIQ